MEEYRYASTSGQSASQGIGSASQKVPGSLSVQMEAVLKRLYGIGSVSQELVNKIGGANTHLAGVGIVGGDQDQPGDLHSMIAAIERAALTIESNVLRANGSL